MRKRWGVLFIVCLASAAPAHAISVASEFTATPTDDVRIESAFPNTNYNYEPEWSKLIAMHSYIGPADTYSLLRFDISAGAYRSVEPFPRRSLTKILQFVKRGSRTIRKLFFGVI